MKDAFVGDIDPVARQMRRQIFNASGAKPYVVQILPQGLLESLRREAGFVDHDLIGIDHQTVVDLALLPQLPECEGAIVSKVLPWLVDDFARNVLIRTKVSNDGPGCIRRFA